MMTHLKKLCSLEGVSGREHPVREYILRVLQQSPADMSVRVDPMGNVLAYVKGRERAKHTLLFAAHMDEVGFMITGVTPEGYLRFTTVGGIDPKVVYGRSVRVGGISGVIGGKATHLCSADEKNRFPSRRSFSSISAPPQRRRLRLWYALETRRCLLANFPVWRAAW